MQPEQLARLMAGEVGVADKLQMSFEAGICQGVGQATHARDKESRWSGRGTGIWISSHTRTVKMEDIPYRDETSSPKPREMSQRRLSTRRLLASVVWRSSRLARALSNTRT